VFNPAKEIVAKLEDAEASSKSFPGQTSAKSDSDSDEN